MITERGRTRGYGLDCLAGGALESNGMKGGRRFGRAAIRPDHEPSPRSKRKLKDGQSLPLRGSPMRRLEGQPNDWERTALGLHCTTP